MVDKLTGWAFGAASALMQMHCDGLQPVASALSACMSDVSADDCGKASAWFVCHGLVKVGDLKLGTQGKPPFLEKSPWNRG